MYCKTAHLLTVAYMKVYRLYRDSLVNMTFFFRWWLSGYHTVWEVRSTSRPPFARYEPP